MDKFRELEQLSQAVHDLSMQKYRKSLQQTQLAERMLRAAGVKDDLRELDSITFRDGVAIIFMRVYHPDVGSKTIRYDLQPSGQLVRN